MLVDRNHLAEKRTVAVVLRLVLDRQGRLVHGEIVDTTGAGVRRFARWASLTPAVQGWAAGGRPADARLFA